MHETPEYRLSEKRSEKQDWNGKREQDANRPHDSKEKDRRHENRVSYLFCYGKEKDELSGTKNRY